MVIRPGGDIAVNNLDDAEYQAAAVKRSKKAVAFSRSDLFKKSALLAVSRNTPSSLFFERMNSFACMLDVDAL